MEPNTLARLKRVAGKQTMTLTHYGRKTWKPHEVTIWFVLDDDKLYIGTANVNGPVSVLRKSASVAPPWHRGRGGFQNVKTAEARRL